MFLDEIGDLPLNLQSKLLRVLENGEYYRLGETHPRYSNARIIAATNRELREEVSFKIAGTDSEVTRKLMTKPVEATRPNSLSRLISLV